MGGNLVTASPIGDSAPVLLALEARGRARVRAEANADCHSTIFSFPTARPRCEPGEILKSIIVPRIAPETRSVRRFYKVSKRREMDISTVAGCFAVSLGEDGTIVRARLAYGGVAAMPARARKTEAALIGKPWQTRDRRRGSAAAGERVHSHLRCARQRRYQAAVDQNPVAEVFCGGTWTPRSESLRKDRAAVGSAGRIALARERAQACHRRSDLRR